MSDGQTAIFFGYYKQVKLKIKYDWHFHYIHELKFWNTRTSRNHCVKSVHIRSYSGPYFWENADKNNFEYGHFHAVNTSVNRTKICCLSNRYSLMISSKYSLTCVFLEIFCNSPFRCYVTNYAFLTWILFYTMMEDN